LQRRAHAGSLAEWVVAIAMCRAANHGRCGDGTRCGLDVIHPRPFGWRRSSNFGRHCSACFIARGRHDGRLGALLNPRSAR
jgi:hypothetical protein